LTDKLLTVHMCFTMCQRDVSVNRLVPDMAFYRSEW